MKRRTLAKELGEVGWYVLRQGRHEIWTNGMETVAVPRHVEIDEFTARIILRTAHKFPGGEKA